MEIQVQRFYRADADASSNLFTSSIRAIEVDSEDNVIAFGILGDRYITTSQDFFLDSAYNYFIAKFDPTGALVWLEPIGSSGYLSTSDNQIGLVLDSDDNIYLHGDALGGSPKDFGNGVTFGFDEFGSFIAKYDANGLTQWVNIIEETKSDAIEVVGEQVVIAERFEENIVFEGNTLVVDYLSSFIFTGWSFPMGA